MNKLEKWSWNLYWNL